jgi:MscS family membrane protein
MGARRYRRWVTRLTVSYESTPEQLEAFCEGVRELIRQHPKTRKDYFQVYVNGLADSAIEVLLYVFHQTADWTEELQERHRLILDILRLAKRLDVEIAYPTQTVHLHKQDAGEAKPPPMPTLSHDAGRDAARAILKVTRDGPAPDGEG